MLHIDSTNFFGNCTMSKSLVGGFVLSNTVCFDDTSWELCEEKEKNNEAHTSSR